MHSGPDGDYLTTKLWDKFLPRWREPYPPASEGMKVKVRELMKAVSDAQRTGAKLGQRISSVPGKLEDLDHIVLTRRVSGYKGKWQILPSKVIEEQSKA